MSKNWKNLKSEHCPICGYDLIKTNDNYRFCKNNSCTFEISRYKFNDIMDDFNREDMKSEMEGFGLDN